MRHEVTARLLASDTKMYFESNRDEINSKLFITFGLIWYFSRFIFVLLHLHLLHAAGMSSEGDGASGRSTTYWKSDTVRFVFGSLNLGNSNS